MPDIATIYHNPRCSKSRQTYELLKSQGIEVEEVPYLTQPPSVETLDRICTLLGVEPLAIFRTGESRFKELGLSKKDVKSRRQWLQILHENPVLIERPIVLYRGKAVMGRPPENVLEIL